MPVSVPVENLVGAVGARRRLLQVNASARAVQQVSRFDGWYSDRLVSEFAGGVGALVDGAAQRSATLTDAYLQSALRRMGADPVSSSFLVSESARAGVTADEAYARLAGQYRWLRSEGRTTAEALQVVRARLDRMVATDVALASREQARLTLASNQVTQYRRVIRPELSRTGACGLCIAASDQVYSTMDLLPLHGGCNCEVLPVVGGEDPGRDLNTADLENLYAAAGDTTGGRELKRVRVQVVEHGELGPSLTNAAQHHRDRAEVAQDTSTPSREALETTVAILEKSLAEARALHAAGTDRSEAIAYLTKQINDRRSRISAMVA